MSRPDKNYNKEEFVVQNMYSGRVSGKQMFRAQEMALKYVEKHLGKTVRIINCDHEKIQRLESQLEVAKGGLTKIRSMGFHTDSVEYSIAFYALKKIEELNNKEPRSGDKERSDA